MVINTLHLSNNFALDTSVAMDKNKLYSLLCPYVLRVNFLETPIVVHKNVSF